MNLPKVFRVLRIGAALFCLVASLLTIGLWVRSHYQQDMLTFRFTGKGGLSVSSEMGNLVALYAKVPGDHVTFTKWHIESKPAGEYSLASNLHINYGFRLIDNPLYSGFSVKAPLWSVSLASGGIGVALMRDWFNRFTIHTLLGITEIVAVVLGLMMKR